MLGTINVGGKVVVAGWVSMWGWNNIAKHLNLETFNSIVVFGASIVALIYIITKLQIARIDKKLKEKELRDSEKEEQEQEE